MFFKRILIEAAISSIENLLRGITDSADLKKIIDTVTKFLKEIAKVLTDNDKDNRTQVQGVWKENKQEVAATALELVEITIKERIDNPDTQRAALLQVKALKQILAPNQGE